MADQIWSSFLNTISSVLGSDTSDTTVTTPQYHRFCSHFKSINESLCEECSLFYQRFLLCKLLDVNLLCVASHVITQFINGTIEADVAFIRLICLFDMMKPPQLMSGRVWHKVLMLEIILHFVAYVVICTSSILCKQTKHKYFELISRYFRNQIRSDLLQWMPIKKDFDIVDFIFTEQFITIPAKNTNHSYFKHYNFHGQIQHILLPYVHHLNGIALIITSFAEFEWSRFIEMAAILFRDALHPTNEHCVKIMGKVKCPKIASILAQKEGYNRDCRSVEYALVTTARSRILYGLEQGEMKREIFPIIFELDRIVLKLLRQRSNDYTQRIKVFMDFHSFFVREISNTQYCIDLVSSILDGGIELDSDHFRQYAFAQKD
eukprot:312461_1